LEEQYIEKDPPLSTWLKVLSFIRGSFHDTMCLSDYYFIVSHFKNRYRTWQNNIVSTFSCRLKGLSAFNICCQRPPITSVCFTLKLVPGYMNCALSHTPTEGGESCSKK